MELIERLEYAADSPCADEPALRDLLRVAATELRALRGFVGRLADETLCDEPNTRCDLDSGPYCSQHGTGHLSEYVSEARVLARSIAGKTGGQ